MSYTYEEEEYRGCTIRIEQDDNPESPREWNNVGTMVCFHDRYNLGDMRPNRYPDECLEHMAAKHDERFQFWARLRESAYYRFCEKDQAMLRIERHYQEHMRRALDERFVILPLYLYDHGGITMSTGPFSCPWDSGRVGFIYCTMDDARKNWMLPDTAGWDYIVYPEDNCPKYAKGSNLVGKTLRQCTEILLEAEVKTYDDYLTGRVAGYVAYDPDDEEIASCWGFYPEHNSKDSEWSEALEQARAEIDAWCARMDHETAERQHWAERDVITT